MSFAIEHKTSPGAIDTLVDDARKGSAEALGRALEWFRPYLATVAARELGRDLQAKAAASDLVQDTLLKAQRDFCAFHGTTFEQLRGWLVRIMRRSVLELRRRYTADGRDLKRERSGGMHERGDEVVWEIADDGESPSNCAIQSERAALLAIALARLSERERLVVGWRHDEGCTFEEIGHRLECSVVSARAAWLRALGRLRDELAALNDDSSIAVKDSTKIP
jgi:RNA polymerase sigma-70 factor (ECF subfamily)